MSNLLYINMDLLILLNGFVKLVAWVSRPLLNKTKLKFKVLKLIDLGFWYLRAMGSWVCCAFCKVYCINSLLRRERKIGPLVQIFRDGRQAPGSRGAHHCCCEWSFSTITEPLVGHRGISPAAFIKSGQIWIFSKFLLQGAHRLASAS